MDGSRLSGDGLSKALVLVCSVRPGFRSGAQKRAHRGPGFRLSAQKPAHGAGAQNRRAGNPGLYTGAQNQRTGTPGLKPGSFKESVVKQLRRPLRHCVRWLLRKRYSDGAKTAGGARDRAACWLIEAQSAQY